MASQPPSTIEVGAAKRPRKANWTASEMEILVSEVGLRSSVLFSSFSGTLNLKMKRKSWEEVTEKINANSSTKRVWGEIKKKWTDMKSQTRKRAASNKRERGKTGGGPAPATELNSLEQMVVSLIPTCQLEGCEGGLESEEIVPVETNPASSTQVTTADIHSPPRRPEISPEPIRDTIITVADVHHEQSPESPVLRPATMNVRSANTDPRPPPPQPSRSRAASLGVAAKSQIISLEERKLDVLSSLLDTQRELLGVERRRLAVEEEKLDILRTSINTSSFSPDLSLSPIIKFY